MLADCGKIDREIPFDTKYLKMIFQSFLRMLRNLQSKDVGECVFQAIEELSIQLTPHWSAAVSSVLESLSNEFESFKDWLEKRLSAFLDKDI
jgi:hypothetical protein